MPRMRKAMPKKTMTKEEMKRKLMKTIKKEEKPDLRIRA